MITDTLYFKKKMAIKTARELFYGKAVINELKNAKSDRELSDILARARHAQLRKGNQRRWEKMISKKFGSTDFVIAANIRRKMDTKIRAMSASDLECEKEPKNR